MYEGISQLVYGPLRRSFRGRLVNRRKEFAIFSLSAKDNSGITQKFETCEVSWQLGTLLTPHVGCHLYYPTRSPYIGHSSPLLQHPLPVFSLPSVAVRTHAALNKLPPPFGSNSKAFLSLLGRPLLKTVENLLQQDGVVPNLLDI